MTRNFGETLTLDEIDVGRDKLIIIKGGDAHIGAVSTAYFEQKKPLTIKVDTMSVPGHKEHLLTDTIARQCAEQLGQTVTVVMGIHFDNLSKSEIEDIVYMTEDLVDRFLTKKN